MGFHRIKVLGVVLLAVLVPVDGLVHARSENPKDSGAKQETPAAAPSLADIIPLASKLSVRLSVLENGVTGLVDVSAVERRYADIEADLKDLADQIARVKESGEYAHRQLVDLRDEIRQENQLLEDAGKPLRDQSVNSGPGERSGWRRRNVGRSGRLSCSQRENPIDSG